MEIKQSKEALYKGELRSLRWPYNINQNCVYRELKRVVRLESFQNTVYVNGTLSRLIFVFHSGSRGVAESYIACSF